jgi:hypothetical protein
MSSNTPSARTAEKDYCHVNFPFCIFEGVNEDMCCFHFSIPPRFAQASTAIKEHDDIE